MQLISGWQKVKPYGDHCIVVQGYKCLCIFDEDLNCLKIYNTESPLSHFSVHEEIIAYVCTKHYGVIRDGQQEQFEHFSGQCIVYANGFFIVSSKQCIETLKDGVVVKSKNLNELTCDISYEPSTKTLAVGTSRNNVYLLDMNLDIIYKISDNQSFVTGVEWQHFNNYWYLATSSNDMTLRIYKYKPNDKVKLWLETVLSDHSDWVLAVAKSPYNNGDWFSCSADQSIIHYQYSDNQWEAHMFGSLGMGQIQSVAAIKSPNLIVFGVTHRGALVKWVHENDNFIIQPGTSGHNLSVTDIQWHSSGCLFSCGIDRTTRLYAPCRINNKLQFKELSRPQVHGYLMQTLGVGTVLVSAGEEKVARVFGVPSVFIKRLEKCEFVKTDKFTTILDNKAIGASLPALGLSNKAIYTSSNTEVDEKVLMKDRFQSYGTDKVFSATLKQTDFPVESQLLQHTLWPELQKLYGCGDNVYAIDTHDYEGNIQIAISCKATSVEQAVIRVYEMTTGLKDQECAWNLMQVLKGHKLTITRLKYSENGEYLLSVGRDRSIHVFNTKDWSSMTVKAHSRIVWDTCWIDNSNFVSCSRDKSVKYWKIDDGNICLVKSENYKQSCTSVAYRDGKFAIGMEDGSVVENGIEIRKHSMTVNRLCYHPFLPILASCSADCTILIDNIQD
eukprot:NODE_26_length_35450_cov_0.398320.p2 type:complete len:670 gc:universal NODE_26_length_35450_cov_0.398320:32384-30375(-)